MIKISQLEQFKEDYKGQTITSKDIYLPPYNHNLPEAEIEQYRFKHAVKMIEEEDQRQSSIDKLKKEQELAAQSIYDSYLSTPNFIEKLCDISDGLIGLADKRTFLMAELQKVNRQLPAAVYIPFVN